MDISKMTLKEKIGQLFIVGFHSLEIDNQMEVLIKEYNAGNIILFQRNVDSIESLSKLTDSIQKLMIENNKIPAFISMDQEGGMVSRMPNDATVFPGNMAVAASQLDKVTDKLGAFTGRELLSCGVNMNLAPVLDVNNNMKNPVIGVRSYGDNPEVVARLGKGQIRGLKGEGVVAVGKHFPGHGDTGKDSHLDLPIVPHTIERLDRIELLPFKKCIEGGLDAIMTSHILFPNLEGKNLPATLSRKILTGLLRGKLEFEGLILSDCMEMKAIADFYGTEKAAVMAIEAGVNLVCISHTLKKQVGAMEAVYNAVKNGVLKEDLIDERVSKVLEFKEKYNLNSNKPKQLSKEELREHSAYTKLVSENSITVVRDKNELLPLKKVSCVISPIARPFTIAEDKIVEINFAKDLSKLINCDYINYDLNNINFDDILRNIRDNDTVVIGTMNVLANNDLQILLDKLLSITKNVVLVALRAPYDCSYKKEEIGSAVAIYEYTQLALDSLYKILLGEIIPKGVLPVEI